MLITRLAGDGVFEPEELAVLREMLEQLCLLRGISLKVLKPKTLLKL